MRERKIGAKERNKGFTNEMKRRIRVNSENKFFGLLN